MFFLSFSSSNLNHTDLHNPHPNALSTSVRAIGREDAPINQRTWHYVCSVASPPSFSILFIQGNDCRQAEAHSLIGARTAAAASMPPVSTAATAEPGSGVGAGTGWLADYRACCLLLAAATTASTTTTPASAFAGVFDSVAVAG